MPVVRLGGPAANRPSTNRFLQGSLGKTVRIVRPLQAGTAGNRCDITQPFGWTAESHDDVLGLQIMPQFLGQSLTGGLAVIGGLHPSHQVSDGRQAFSSGGRHGLLPCRIPGGKLGFYQLQDHGSQIGGVGWCGEKGHDGSRLFLWAGRQRGGEELNGCPHRVMLAESAPSATA